MSKKGIPAGAIVRGTDKGYVHGDLKPGSERPVEKIEKTYPYMRPRDAATLILVRMKGKTPEVLMGCRAAAHAFMPNRYVFPGGRVDRADAHVPIATKDADDWLALMDQAIADCGHAGPHVERMRETFRRVAHMLVNDLQDWGLKAASA